MNKLYLIDGREDIYKIVQEQGQNNSRYIVEEQKSVSNLKNFQSQISEFKD